MKKVSTFSKLVIVFILGFIVLNPVIALAANKDAVCEGAGLVGGSSGCAPEAGSLSVADVVKGGLNLFSVVIGIVAVVMMMIGGIKYITSQGDATQTNNAKNTILYAAIGLAVAALSQIIVQFVLSRLTT